jgi:DNA-binding MarR family transcriptional regulator
MRNWSFITNHSVVLMYVGRHAESTVREISLAVGLSDRCITSILRDFEADGYLTRRRIGRNMHYTVDVVAVFRHQTQKGQTLGELVVWLADIYNERRDGPPS